MLSSQHPPLPPQHNFHRTHKLAPGVNREHHIMRGEVADQTEKKPSRLEQMKADYQRMMLKKKEEKMLQVYEESQKKAMMRVTRVGSGVGTQKGMSHPHGNVRVFFNERRKMAANGLPIPSIDHHYRQVKAQSPAEWTNRTGSGSSVKTQKSSAGRDRAHLLAPIQRQQDNEAVNQNNVRSGIPLRKHSNERRELNPFDTKPKMVKHPLPLTDKNVHDGLGASRPSGLAKLHYGSKAQSQPNLARSPLINQKQFPAEDDPPAAGQGKLTDFQKWQLEQNKAREKRLWKVNHQKPKDDTVWPDPEYEPGFNDKEEEKGQGDEGTVDNAKIKELEKQLLQRIAREQQELKRIQLERKREEEEERKELEKQKKKEAVEKVRYKKQEEERRREEERRHQTEEEDERLDREREERRRAVEEEQQRKERLHKADDRKRLALVNKRLRDEAENEEDIDGRTSHTQPLTLQNNLSLTKRPEPKPTRSKASVHDPDDLPADTSGASYYLQAADQSEAKGSSGHLKKCTLCGRSFAVDRLVKHEKACSKANKPRKEFDSSKKRVEGTELAKYVGKAKRPEPPKKKSNWRTHHQQFIESLRYAKKVTQIEKEGGDLRSLAPPPLTTDPDLVPCPHCGRTFNESAAERHIPRCKDLKTRPPPMNTRRK